MDNESKNITRQKLKWGDGGGDFGHLKVEKHKLTNYRRRWSDHGSQSHQCTEEEKCLHFYFYCKNSFLEKREKNMNSRELPKQKDLKRQ